MAAHRPILEAIDAELDQLRPRTLRTRRWRRACPGLSTSDATAPREIASWVRSLPSKEANEVLGGLAALAQDGDEEALLVV